MKTILGFAALLLAPSLSLLAQDTPNTVTPTASLLVPITPCRMVDTRAASQYPAPYGAPNIPPGTGRTFHIATGFIVPGNGQFGCGVPAGATAISATFTVDNTDTSQTYTPAVKWGDLRVYPSGGTVPLVSMLNWTKLTGAVADAASVPLSPSGDLSVLVDGYGTYGADVIIDILGYYIPGQPAGAAPIGGIGGCIAGSTATLPSWAKCVSAVVDPRIKAGMVFGSSYLTRTADDQIPVRIFNIHDGGFSFEIQTGTTFMWFGGAQ